MWSEVPTVSDHLTLTSNLPDLSQHLNPGRCHHWHGGLSSPCDWYSFFSSIHFSCKHGKLLNDEPDKWQAHDWLAILVVGVTVAKGDLHSASVIIGDLHVGLLLHVCHSVISFRDRQQRRHWKMFWPEFWHQLFLTLVAKDRAAESRKCAFLSNSPLSRKRHTVSKCSIYNARWVRINGEHLTTFQTSNVYIFFFFAFDFWQMYIKTLRDYERCKLPDSEGIAICVSNKSI
jgi:hypothetical protein